MFMIVVQKMIVMVIVIGSDYGGGLHWWCFHILFNLSLTEVIHKHYNVNVTEIYKDGLWKFWILITTVIVKYSVDLFAVLPIAVNLVTYIIIE